MEQTFNPLRDVKEFHETFKLPVLTFPQIPSVERRKLRISLNQEENKEFSDACIEENIVEVLDALCDLQYVLTGAVLEFGLGSVFETAFAEVHRSNMSKACLTEKEADETINHYNQRDGTIGYKVFDEVKNVWFVYRKDDNKLLKSINYSPANLKAILEKEFYKQGV